MTFLTINYHPSNFVFSHYYIANHPLNIFISPFATAQDFLFGSRNFTISLQFLIVSVTKIRGGESNQIAIIK